MVEAPKLPPYLPEELHDERGVWIGALSPYNPQLLVVRGPSLEELHTAFKNESSVRFTFESRTGDQDLEDLNDHEGEREVFIEKLFEKGEEGIHFLATGSDLPLTGSYLWVFGYDPEHGMGGADVFVR